MIALLRIDTMLGRMSILNWPAVVWRSSPPLGLIPTETTTRVEVLTSADDPPPFLVNQRVMVLMAPLNRPVVVFYATILRLEASGSPSDWRLELQLSTEALDC